MEGLCRNEARAQGDRDKKRRGPVGKTGMEEATVLEAEGHPGSDLGCTAVGVLTTGAPSDHKKSPSMVLSLSPIHWYSR